jgi:NADPH:quinone reductase
MHAVRAEQFGLDKVQVRELPDPTPGMGEVVIATEAATINPADAAVVSGAAAPRFPRGAAGPFTPGWDLVGTVNACGDGVDSSLIGERVLGFSLWFESFRGTQASQVALPLGNIVAVSGDLPGPRLTTVGLNGLTAWRGLADLKLKDGETVAITGAVGGVGGFAVELAASRGHSVIALVRNDDIDEAIALGATSAVDVGAGDLGQTVREIVPDGVDALLDTASLGAQTLAAIHDDGKYVTVTALPDSERGIDVFRSGGRMDSDALSTLAQMATSGQVHTPVAQVFPLDEARAAYDAFGKRIGRGRIVLTFPTT